MSHSERLWRRCRRYPAAVALLGGRPGFAAYAGAAENTMLPAGSVDWVTAAQAFHWFDVTQTRREAERILRASGWAVLLWNTRRHDARTILFGAGVILLTTRLEKSGKPDAYDVFFRRNLWLIAFGLFNAWVLLWFGDILFLYAVCAMAVFWCRRFPPRTLLILGVLVIAVSSAIYLLFGASMPHWPPEQLAEFIEQDWQPGAEQLARDVARVNDAGRFISGRHGTARRCRWFRELPRSSGAARSSGSPVQ